MNEVFSKFKTLERSVQLKWLVIGFGLLMVINLTVFNAVNTRFEVKGTTFKLESAVSREYTFKDQDGEILNAKVIDGRLVYDDVLITYKGQLITKLYDDSDNSSNIFLDGELIGPGYQRIKYLRETSNQPLKYEQLLVKEIEHFDDYKLQSILAKMILLSVVLLFSGLLSIYYPEVSWKWRTLLLVKNGEPSDFHLKSSRFGGRLALVLMIVVPWIVNMVY